jgi:hypothetical protein
MFVVYSSARNFQLFKQHNITGVISLNKFRLRGNKACPVAIKAIPLYSPGHQFLKGMKINMFKNGKFKILKNQPNPIKREKSAFITQAVSQKDAVQDETNVSHPSDANVKEARNWVNHNKK